MKKAEPLPEINERVARLNALATLLLLATFLLTREVWLVLSLGADFFLRGFVSPRYSPISRLNQWLLHLLHVSPFMIDARRKIFAARLGFILCVVIAWLALGGHLLAAQVVSGVMMLFAALEALLGFCVACYLYGWLYHWSQRASTQGGD